MKPKHVLRKSKLALPLTAFMFAAGCAGTPDTPPLALNQARESYQRALSDPQVARFASTELNRAGVALQRAERWWLEGEDIDDVTHQAYLAQQRSRIAMETANARTARERMEQATLQRQNVVAQARQAEAAARQRKAEQERAAAEAQRLAAQQQAQRARLQAQREQERAAEIKNEATQQISRLEAELQQLQAQQTNRGWVLSVSGDVLFDVGQSVLKPGAYRSLNELAQFLRDHPEQTVVVEGYTDATGSEESNLALAQRRAEAVKQALVTQNIAPDRVMTRAFGESFPVAGNDTAAGRQLNRRVEFVIPRTSVAGLAR